MRNASPVHRGVPSAGQSVEMLPEHAMRDLTVVVGLTEDIALAAAPLPGSVHGDIEEALNPTATADAQAIHVDVDGSVVTLCGTARSRAHAAAAVNAAWGCLGVTQVVDGLVIVD